MNCGCCCACVAGADGSGAPVITFRYISVRLEFGELVVPVRDQAMGGMFGEPGFSNCRNRPTDPRRGAFMLSYSSLVYVSQSQIPSDFWSSAVRMYFTPPQYVCSCWSEL